MLVRIPNAFASGKGRVCHLESGDYMFPNTDFDVLFFFFFFILFSNKIILVPDFLPYKYTNVIIDFTI